MLRRNNFFTPRNRHKMLHRNIAIYPENSFKSQQINRVKIPPKNQTGNSAGHEQISA